MIVPVLLFLGLQSQLGNRPGSSSASGEQGAVGQILKTSWNGVKANIVSRAAVELQEDFRNGLGNWSGQGAWAKSWSYDQAGMVRPGSLALFEPSLDLQDYSMEFLAQIDRAAIGWAYRAADSRNYYAAKLVREDDSPLPAVNLVRYAVIDGKEGPRTTVPVHLSVRPDTVYRIQVEANGSDFTTTIQGRVVDFFSDSRLTQGGVGLFGGKNERALVRWVEVTHQSDVLGRLCAYLRPDNLPIKNGSLSR
jgi:hypothetical protein